MEDLEKVLEDHAQWVASEGKEGTQAALSDVAFQGAYLEGVNLRGAVLSRTNFAGAHLRRAELSSVPTLIDWHEPESVPADLEQSTLTGADLRHANLAGANLSDANLEGANLEGANLGWTRLHGTNLAGANLKAANFEGAHLWRTNLRNANLDGVSFCMKTNGARQGEIVWRAEIDERTVALSGWTLAQLRWLRVSGAHLERNLLERLLVEGDEGLTLYFDRRVTRWDQTLIEAFILGMLGRDTACRVAEFRETGERGAIARLEGVNRPELELVANALWERVWEDSTRAHSEALVSMHESMAQYLAPLMQQGLSELRAQLDRIELRQRSDAVVNAEERWANRENDAAVLETVRTWRTTEQKAIGAARHVLLKVADKVTGNIVGAVVDAVGEVAQDVIESKK